MSSDQFSSAVFADKSILAAADDESLHDASQASSAGQAVAATTPFWAYQWSLRGTASSAGVKAATAWADYTGRGVKVGIVDEGFDLTNPDLAGRFDLSLSQDPRDKAAVSIMPDLATQSHGTWVASVLGAKAGDGYGAVGVAYDAELVGYYLRHTGGSLRSEVAGLLGAQKNVDVSNNSWGYTTAFADNLTDPIWASVAKAIDDAAANGRGGLGTIMVFAAGNDRAYVPGDASQDGDNTNSHGLTNSRKTISVGATDENGKVASFSTPGASLFVVAPGVDVAASGRGDGSSNLAIVSGTSFAAPIVSGVVALMLEANPGLGYRDVQKILAISSMRTDAASSSWSRNGADSWNGGGYAVSHDYGFGLVDAVAATRLAEVWTATSTAANEEVIAASAPTGLLGALTDGVARDVKLTIADSDFSVGWAEVDIDITHTHVGDLVIDLISPDGTASRLVDRPGDGQNGRDNLSFRFSTTHNWGESAAGTWTVRVLDAGQGGSGSLNAVSMRLYGEHVGDDNTYFYTNDFTKLGSGPSVLSDASGVDQINTAAVSSAVDIDLAAGRSAQIAGRIVTIAQGTIIENVTTGDGDDRVFGNDAANTLIGGRGADTLAGEGGNDVISGGAGDDSLGGGSGRDLLSGNDGNDVTSGGAGNDTIMGGAGRDTLGGDAGDDRMFGDDGDDLMDGGAGNDILYGGAGADTIYGDLGNDVIFGGEGADRLFGGAGRDSLQGGSGDDWLNGGQGADTLVGGEGADVFVFAMDGFGRGVDKIVDFEQGLDRIGISAIVQTFGLGANSFGSWLVQERDQDESLVSIRISSPTSPDDTVRLVTLQLASGQALTPADFIL